jgi:hypothetical protein
MTNSNLDSPRRFLFNRLLQVLYKPGEVFNWVTSESGRVWSMPLLLLTIVTMIRVAVSGWLQARAAMMGEIPLPPDWIYYTPEMQEQYMQAAQATSSPVFVYILPAVISLAAIWLGWLIVSSLLHLAFTLTGGRGSNLSSLNVVAWAGVPFSLREIMRIIYLLIVRQPIVNVGLSGFVDTANGGGSLFLSGLLALTDIFLLWHIILLITGSKRTEAVSAKKSVFVTLVVILLVLAAQAGFSYMGGMLGGMMVTRPFYF